ncbi:MAG: ABC-three component system protein [Candidatus Electrothrix sp. GW3-4]|uniref:ABC-three component system protein n=1 Tax=Candidatus Electrothrix sp. GW3-4 TaxID=3126740 RepID=UPI0030CB2985
MTKRYITAQNVSVGKQIAPIKMVYLFSADEYEEFIEEWIDTKKDKYIRTEKNAGAGDMGRDIIAYIEDPKSNPEKYKWDCYQCKHYSNPLVPSNIWVEFGKILFYTFKKEYPVPEKYYFVPPKGVGTALSALLSNTSKLKVELQKNWDKHCKYKITKTKDIKLSGEFLNYFNKFDFSIFDKIPPKKVIEQHAKHENHLLRFGGGLPERKVIEEIPKVDTDKELRYIKQLTLAYNSDSQDDIKTVNDIEIYNKYKQHFHRARKSFYHAEELRIFTRDNLPAQVFDDFQEEVFQSVANTAEDDFENAFTKVKTVENQAVKTPIESNPLREVCNTIDKKGICHQLVNKEIISWINDNE